MERGVAAVQWVGCSWSGLGGVWLQCSGWGVAAVGGVWLQWVGRGCNGWDAATVGGPGVAAEQWVGRGRWGLGGVAAVQCG